MLRPKTAWLLTGLACLPTLLTAQDRTARPSPPTVPIVADLMTVSAVHEQRGDYESILRISSVTSDGVEYTVSGNVEERRVIIRRKVRAQDWAHAREWNPRYNMEDPEVFPGTTGGTLSADVLNDLKLKGQTTLKVSAGDELAGILGGALGGLLGGTLNPATTLKRVEPQPVRVPMLVNDVAVELPAIHARGEIDGDPFEVFILDNAAVPMVLRWSLGDTSKRMIRISFPTRASHIEENLSTTCRADVYGIYFDFAKATIRPESEPVLKEIAGIVAKNPSWKLGVEGHTDNIGGTAANQELSIRRASAVRQALVDRYHVASARLTPAGYGESRPKDTNETLEGRGRNRRVELARQPGC